MFNQEIFKDQHYLLANRNHDAYKRHYQRPLYQGKSQVPEMQTCCGVLGCDHGKDSMRASCLISSADGNFSSETGFYESGLNDIQSS